MAAEAALNALKKLEANKTCANCDAYNKFGFQNVCDKFKTFVCANCKSAHQSYSHRVKSVSMSNWSMDEVDALREENGGGNAVARRVWLANWDEHAMRKPNDKDHVDYFKKFVNKVFNEQAFYDERGLTASSSSSRSQAPSRAAAQAPAPAANLLDFGAPAQTKQSNGSFDAFGGDWAASSTASSNSNAGADWGNFASAPAAAAPAPASNGAFFADFGSPPSSSTASNSNNDGFAAFSAPPPPAPTASNDMFGAFTAAPAPAPAAPPAFDPFASSSQAPIAPTPVASFDPFGASSAPTSYSKPAAPANAFGSFQAAAPAPSGGNFSAFDALSAPAHGQNMGYANGYGMRPGGGMGMGMGMAPQMNGMNGMMGGPTHGYGMPSRQGMGNTGSNISSYMAPSGGRPGGPSHGSRDPFAGLGLPQ